MLNGGGVDSGEGGIAFGTSSQTVHCRATHVDTDPIHYNISFGDALLYISSVKRACSVKSFRPWLFCHAFRYKSYRESKKKT